MSTIIVSEIKGYQYALRMEWQKHPKLHDINDAFDVILKKLTTTDQKIYIIVDISTNPRFPLSMTVSRASQVHRHPKMGDWLVVGSNTMAKFIGSTISALSESKVLWFDTEEDALHHLSGVTV